MAGQLVGTSDARGCGENIAHDAVGRILAEDYSPCENSQPTYTAPNLTTGDGTEAFYVYDALPSTAVTMPGYLMSVADRAQKTIYNYDMRGRISGVQRQVAVPESNPSLSARYAPHTFQRLVAYAEDNRPVTIGTGADAPELLGVGNAPSTVSLAYKIEGPLDSIQSTYGALLQSQQVDATGSPVSQTFGDQAGTTAAMVYDGNGTLTSYSLSRRPGPWLGILSPPASTDPNDKTFEGVLTNLSIGSDKLGNPVTITEAGGTQGSNPAEWAPGNQPVSRKLAYWDDYRLKGIAYTYAGPKAPKDTFVSPYAAEVADGDTTFPPVTQPATNARVASQTFDYDYLGNTAHSVDDSTPPVFYDRSLGTIANGMQTRGPNQIQSASIDNLHNLSTSYDNAGNTTSVAVENGSNPDTGSVYAYDWDEVGRLASATRNDAANLNSAVAETFTYSAYGERTATARQDSGAPSAVYTVRVFDSLVLEDAAFDAGSGDYQHTAVTEHVYLGGGGAGLAHAFYAKDNTPLASSGKVHVFMTYGDPKGSTSFLVDHDTGELLEHITYQAYGAVETDYRSPRWDNFRESIRHTGHWDDAEVGLIYFGARYYAPALGRWLSPDPLAIHGLGGDANPYAFAAGSPVGNVDPYGLDSGCLGSESVCGQGSTAWGPFDFSGVHINLAPVGKAIGKFFSGLFGSSAPSGPPAIGHSLTPSSGLGRVGGNADCAGVSCHTSYDFDPGIPIGRAASEVGEFAFIQGVTAVASLLGPENTANALRDGQEGVRAISNNEVLISLTGTAVLGAVGKVGGALLEDAAGTAATLPQYLYHYSSEETAALIEGSQLGVPGRVLYLTPNGGLQPLQAGIDLALPQANTASAVFRVPSTALVPANILRVGPVTGNVLGRAGGGVELLYNGTIPIEWVTRVR